MGLPPSDSPLNFTSKYWSNFSPSLKLKTSFVGPCNGLLTGSRDDFWIQNYPSRILRQILRQNPLRTFLLAQRTSLLRALKAFKDQIFTQPITPTSMKSTTHEIFMTLSLSVWTPIRLLIFRPFWDFLRAFKGSQRGWNNF